jgi:dUTP pyrophosphatase
MNLLNCTHEHPTLYLAVDPAFPELRTLYENAIEKHNFSVLNDLNPNAGFDLFFPEEVEFGSIDTSMVNFRIKCEMRLHNTLENTSRSCGYYLYPRSSISKTKLMLANQTGIIDSGYRGWILGAFRYLGESGKGEKVEKDARLLQICAPKLEPFIVALVEESHLSDSTRGSGGFGSTGK